MHISSGSMKLEQLRAQDLIFRSSSGSLEAGGLQGSVDINMSSGRLSIGSIEGERHHIRSSSGSIEIRALTGALVLRSSSGSAVLGISRLAGDLSFDISSGNLDIRLPQNTGFKLDAETSSGSVTIFSPNGAFEIKNRSSVLRPIGENPEYTIAARVRSGNIHILRE
jgi:lia operon protein LiaG